MKVNSDNAQIFNYLFVHNYQPKIIIKNLLTFNYLYGIVLVDKRKGVVAMNNITLQYTLFCTTGQYKPVSCLIEITDVKYFNEHQEEFKKRAIEKICLKRYWNTADLKRYGYTKIKCRRYEKNA